ncbi:phage tail protein [Paraburkholderia sp. SIMBA_030]|uniref:phage tail protein n=1 Tax=Paraburkholderia sp. SIMBA_030 TaxID=3085773 RepID=UPI00397B1BEE
MIDIFEWVPTVANYSGSATLRVRKAQFGDGYAQRVKDGLNNRASSFSLTFINNAETITAIVAFLDAHDGSSGFYWQPPLRDPGLFTCENYSEPTKDGGVYTLSATFNQTFAA